MKRLKVLALLVTFLILTAIPARAAYIVQFPSGLGAFYDKVGTMYTPNSIGQATVTDVNQLQYFLHSGFTLVSGTPVILYKDFGTSYAANGTTTTVDGTSITIPAGLMTAGRAIRVTVYGTIAGGNAVKGVNLYLGSSAVSSPRFLATAVGNFKAEFLLTEYTDAAHQNVVACATAGTVAGATTSVAADNQATTVNLASAAALKTQVYSNHANDTVTQTACVIELVP